MTYQHNDALGSPVATTNAAGQVVEVTIICMDKQAQRHVSGGLPTYRAYSLVRVFTDGVAIGPILMGISKPVHILTTSATSRRVMNMTAIAAVDAQIRRQRDAEKAAADKVIPRF
ncbi:phosphate acyltransferase [Xanthomonas prunicola]|uniref:Phosphate acyltransferase n=1 Tax=Xanthomonas prunicola TaxID=2053930 RepID=A0A9Q9J0M7_9XANT|nr:phosphate acyltransferase [Xanthomonas prunicola]UXA64345.1 phosphate acyltransferase [Xanthomonas prunicola]